MIPFDFAQGFGAKTGQALAPPVKARGIGMTPFRITCTESLSRIIDSRSKGHNRECFRVILLRDIWPLLPTATRGSSHARKTRGSVSLTASRSPRTSSIKNSCAFGIRLDGRYAESSSHLVSLERKRVRDNPIVNTLLVSLPPHILFPPALP